jgi:hypothetical protein
MDRFAIPLVESFELAGIRRGKGYSLAKAGRWAPVHYIDSNPVVLRDEFLSFLKTLPTERTHKRGGYRPIKSEAPA